MCSYAHVSGLHWLLLADSYYQHVLSAVSNRTLQYGQVGPPILGKLYKQLSLGILRCERIFRAYTYSVCERSQSCLPNFLPSAI